MSSMQAFYTNVFTPGKPQSQFAAYLRIAKASLKQVLAVRSELAWDIWKEAKASSPSN